MCSGDGDSIMYGNCIDFSLMDHLSGGVVESWQWSRVGAFSCIVINPHCHCYWKHILNADWMKLCNAMSNWVCVCVS